MEWYAAVPTNVMILRKLILREEKVQVFED